MNKFRVKWSTGRKTEYETEQSEGEFRARMFGHPTRLPDGVVFETVTEAQNAAETGEVEEGNLGEHQDGDGSGSTTETGGGDRDVESRLVEGQEEVNG